VCDGRTDGQTDSRQIFMSTVAITTTTTTTTTNNNNN